MAQTNAHPNGKQKRTYVLSSRTLERFEAQVSPGKRGVAIDEAIEHWLEEKRLATIRAAFEEFGRDEESQALYAQIDRECSRASDEVWSAIDDDWAKMSAQEMDKEFNG